MNWLFRLIRADNLLKQAEIGDIAISFGRANISSLQNMINSMPSTIDQTRRYDFNNVKNNPNIGTILSNNGQTLISAKAVESVIAALYGFDFRLRGELNRLREELNNRVQLRQQELEQRYAKTKRVTSFELIEATSSKFVYAISWTSHLADKPRAYLFSGLDPNAQAFNPIRFEIQNRLGIQLVRLPKRRLNEWIVTGLNPDMIPALAQVFTELGYDASLVANSMNIDIEEQAQGPSEKFLVTFDNVAATTDYYLSVNLKQFAGREKDILPDFIDVVEKIFTIKGKAPVRTQPQQPQPQPQPYQEPQVLQPQQQPLVIAQVMSTRKRENDALKREALIQPAGVYYQAGDTAIFFKGDYNVFMDFLKLLIMKNFNASDLMFKALKKGSALRNSGYIKEQRIINNVVDGYPLPRANRQYTKDPNTGLDLADEKKFLAEINEITEKGPYNLYPLQGKGAMWLYSRQSALLGDETGVGKTEELVVAALMRTKEKNMWNKKLATGKILIFTLASVVEQFAQRILQIQGMPSDSEALRHPDCPVKFRVEDMNKPGAKWLVLSYGKINTLTKEQQQAQMEEEEADDAIEVVDDDMASIRKEQRQELVAELIQQLRLQNFDVMILDESHMVKNSTSNTSKNIALISKTIPFKWGASATVSANNPSDLHRQLLAVGNSMGYMTRRSFNQKYTGMKAQKIRGQEGNEDEENLADPSNAKNFLKFVREQYPIFDSLDLNGKQDIVKQLSDQYLRPIVDEQITKVIDLHAMLILTDVYQRKTKKQVRSDLPDHTRKPEFIPTDDNTRLALVESVKRRLEQKKTNEENPDSKLTRLGAYRQEMALLKVPYTTNKAMEMINRGEKVLIFTCFVESAQALQASLQSQLQPNGMEVYMAMGGEGAKHEMIEEFRNLQSPVRAFVLGVLSSGTGIDLPNIVSNVIVNDISWTPKDADQVEGRAFRVNSNNSVVTHYIVLDGTPDTVIYQTVQKKRDIAKRIQDIDEQYAEKIRTGGSVYKELKAAQNEHWELVQEQLMSETAVQHYWAEQERIPGPRRTAHNWLQNLLHEIRYN